MVLHPKDVEVGDLIQARDPVGHWYNAKVIAKAGRGASVSATVHYTRFGPSHTEKFTVAKQGLRERGLLSTVELKEEADLATYDGIITGRNPDGTWDIERVLALKKIKSTWYALVRWAGWGAEDDTWEPKVEIPAAFLEEFQDTEAACKKPQKQPRQLFTAELTAHESTELFEFRVADCYLWLAAMRTDGCAKAGRQQTAASEVRIYSTKPFSPGAFKALREHFVRAATAADPKCNVGAAVTPISSHRGGVPPQPRHQRQARTLQARVWAFGRHTFASELRR